ncbi:hypothetical protein GCM10010302_31320 [Streptomyces polychromogenes]|uniref:Uncharacterized protein n=1 Tax=Streptomyces polychromogenes TaxID=67342 RepID=A0ABN0VDM5_9ACTN
MRPVVAGPTMVRVPVPVPVPVLESPVLQRALKKDRTAVTVILPADIPPSPVSVVGDFNDRQPGVHPLTPRKDGKRALTVEPPGGSAHSFRYLAAGDYWFNDESADDQDGPNSLHYSDATTGVSPAPPLCTG